MNAIPVGALPIGPALPAFHLASHVLAGLQRHGDEPTAPVLVASLPLKVRRL